MENNQENQLIVPTQIQNELELQLALLEIIDDSNMSLQIEIESLVFFKHYIEIDNFTIENNIVKLFFDERKIFEFQYDYVEVVRDDVIVIANEDDYVTFRFR